jgi:hypothetical protein
MNTERYPSIEAARKAGKSKGSLWAISLSINERYLGHIFQLSYTTLLIVTQRGSLIFSPDEVKSIQCVDDVNVTWIEHTHWPSDPYM